MHDSFLRHDGRPLIGLACIVLLFVRAWHILIVLHQSASGVGFRSLAVLLWLHLKQRRCGLNWSLQVKLFAVSSRIVAVEVLSSVPVACLLLNTSRVLRRWNQSRLFWSFSIHYFALEPTKVDGHDKILTVSRVSCTLLHSVSLLRRCGMTFWRQILTLIQFGTWFYVLKFELL